MVTKQAPMIVKTFLLQLCINLKILKMVKFLQYYDIGKRPSEQAFSEVDMEDLILFMMQVQEYLKLLKPFTNQSEDEQ